MIIFVFNVLVDCLVNIGATVLMSAPQHLLLSSVTRYTHQVRKSAPSTTLELSLKPYTRLEVNGDKSQNSEFGNKMGRVR